ncbi:DUF4190 domain-containing protein [Gordonia mangrovi]|nr:DUF4190 domain-containing protein [Gordonia mangrovi]UVF80124.1 DUF4190 domain-containing protein [Gordonia mangrovi]
MPTRTVAVPPTDEQTSRVSREPEPAPETQAQQPTPAAEADDSRPLQGPAPAATSSTTTAMDEDQPSKPAQAYSSIEIDDDKRPEEQVPTRNQPARTSQAAKPRRTNRTAIWALVLSLLGITSPIGLYLGYRSRSQIARTRELGEPFARVAIWIGWLYLAVIVLGLVTYFWIAGQGS